MSTKWVVTTAAKRTELGDKRTGEITFTVNNPSGSADRAMFDPVVSQEAGEGWFTVEEPQRLVRGGASVPYVMKVAVPVEAPPGEYAVQARVYSADAAPEESSVLSPRVMVAVPAPPEPVKRRWPWWWWLVAAGLAVVLLIAIGVLVFGGGGGDDKAGPAPSRAAGAEDLTMPDLLGMSERDALRTLAELGLTVRPIKYRHDPEQPDQVVRQSIEPHQAVSPEAVVDLEVAVELAAPAVTAPPGVQLLEAGAGNPVLEWDTGASPAREWLVTWSRERCRYTTRQFVPFVSDLTGCYFPEADGSDTEATNSYTLSLTFPSRTVVGGGSGTLHTGWVRWQVAALDDFGTPGPASEPAYFRAPVLP